ncbi:MAG: protein-disulfide reductase DsbD domain-containing protein [Stappiaceae bacterium]
MMTKFTSAGLRVARLFLPGFLVVVSGIDVSKAEVGPWSGTPEGQVRMLTAGSQQDDDGRYIAGIEIALEPGWKTYWENPGESGIPTTLDFSQSDNLKQATTLFPIPERYNDGYATSLVYHDLVVLPLLLTPEDPALPIRLKAQMSYGVCEEVCIPADATLEGQVGPEQKVDTVTAEMIMRAMADLPSPASADAPVKITDITVENGTGSPPRLTITAQLADEATVPDLFVVAPEGSYISLPQLIEQSQKEARWGLSLEGLAATEENAALRFTLVQGNDAIEKNWPLPKSLRD